MTDTDGLAADPLVAFDSDGRRDEKATGEGAPDRAARTMINQNPKFRLAFYEILRACEDRVRPLDELEGLVAALPGFDRLNQPPYFPIQWLAEAGALEELYLDEEGDVHDGAEVAALDEDAFDDLVAQFAYRATETGLGELDALRPSTRLAQLADLEPARAPIYRELLSFCTTRRSFAEINRHMGSLGLFNRESANPSAPTPGVYVDKLAQAGGIVFDTGWLTTEEGRGYLEGEG